MSTHPTNAILAEQLQQLVSIYDLHYLNTVFASYHKEVNAIRSITDSLANEEQTPGITQALSRAADYMQTLTSTLIRTIEIYFKGTYFIDFGPYQHGPGEVLENANGIVEFIIVQIGDLLHHAGGSNLRQFLHDQFKGCQVKQRAEKLIIANAVRMHGGSDGTKRRIVQVDNTALILASYMKFCYDDTTQLTPKERHTVESWLQEIPASGATLFNTHFTMTVKKNGTVYLRHPTQSDALAFAHFLEIQMSDSPDL